MATELPRTRRTPEGEGRIEIDGTVWRPGDIGRDARGEIFRLNQSANGWFWSSFDTEYNWTVGDPDGPHPPLTKMRLIEANK